MIKKLLKTSSSFLSLLLSNKPKVFWWSMVRIHNSDKENFGDIITPYLVLKLSKIEPVYFDPRSNFSKFFTHTLMVGSIASIANQSSIVWGSGIIRKDEVLKPACFKAVRGPKTAFRLFELGIKSPLIYGDPAILLPLLYSPKVVKKYKIGLIAHYVDFEELKLKIKDYSNVLLINLLTDDVECVIDKILLCEKVISTSLHGIIVANSYNIPTKWWKYSNNLSGDDIKFYDYFESFNLHNVNSHEGFEINKLVENEDFFIVDRNILLKLQLGLLNSYPYKIKNKKICEMVQIHKRTRTN